MSVLETFLILFESNAGEVKKEAVAAKKVTDDLEKSLSETDRRAIALKGAFVGMAGVAVAAIGSLVSLGALIGGAFAAAAVADKVGEVSRSLNIATEDISAFGDAAKKEGGSLDAFIGDITGLTAAATQLDVTGKSRLAPFFRELGINVTDASGKAKAAIPLLYEISGAFEGMSKQESIGFGRKLGLSTGTIILLQQGRRGLEEIIRKQKELGVITERQTQIADAYGDQLDDTSVAFRTLFLQMAENVLPIFTKFMESLAKAAGLVERNSRLIISGILAIAAAITVSLAPALGAMFWNFVRIPIMAFIATASIAGFGGAVGIAAAATWAFLAPILAIIGVVGLLALIIEDLWSLLEGGPSLFGDIAEAIINWLVGAFETLIGKVKWLKNFLGFGGDVGDALSSGSRQLGSANSSGISSTTSNAITNGGRTNSSVVNVGEVNVQTQATDADGMAAAASKSLGRELRQTQDNFDDGIRA